MAKSLVAGGLAKRCLVQLSYAIGVAQPLSVFVDSYGTATEDRTDADLTVCARIYISAHFDKIEVLDVGVSNFSGKFHLCAK